MRSKEALKIMQTFNEKNIPNLDVCVLGALELFSRKKPQRFRLRKCKRPLVVGSGNAAVTGKILFEKNDAVVADESTYKTKLKFGHGIDGAVLISASGGKSSVAIARDLRRRQIDTWLLTNNENALADDYVDPKRDIVFPKNREPYTYNTSTYMGMIIGNTRENPRKVLRFISNKIDPIIPKRFKNYDSFYMIVPEKFDSIRELFMTKFDELFGSKISGRIFTLGQTKHAKTIVSSEKEFFISFGDKNNEFGSVKNRLYVPLPGWASHATIMAIGYYIIGKIQEQNPPYFKKNISTYTKKVSQIFNQKIKPIVE